MDVVSGFKLPYVIGENVPKAFTSIDDFKFHSSLKEHVKSLELVGGLPPLVLTAGPSITYGKDVIIVSKDVGPNTRFRRVLAYMLPILKIIGAPIVPQLFHKSKAKRIKEFRDGASPKVLFVCPTRGASATMESQLARLLDKSGVALNVKNCATSDDFISAVRGTSKLDIVIMNIGSVKETLMVYEGKILMKRLKFLVIEEFECFQEQANISLDYLLKLTMDMQLQVNWESPFQTIIGSCSWSLNLEALYSKLSINRRPDLFIDDLGDVLKLARISWNVHFAGEKHDRVEVFKNAFKDLLEKKGKNIVIACATSADAQMLQSTIQQSFARQAAIISSKVEATTTDSQEDSSKAAIVIIPTSTKRDGYKAVSSTKAATPKNSQNSSHSLEATSKVTRSNPPKEAEKLATFNNSQTDSSKPVDEIAPQISIVTDDMLTSTVGIVKCSTLINYDCPSEKDSGQSNQQSVIRMRLGYMWPSLPKLDSAKHRPCMERLTFHLILTGKEPQFLKLYRFTKSLDMNDVHLSLELAEIAKQMIAKEELKDNLCMGIKWFGYCDQPKCFHRHKFNMQDVSIPPSTPAFGEVEFRILECVHPSEYNAVLLEHYQFKDGKRVMLMSYEEERVYRKSLMDKYYSLENNRSLEEIEIGQNYAYQISGKNEYARVKVLRKASAAQKNQLNLLAPKTHSDDSKKFIVLCMDTGKRFEVKSSTLYRLPEEFREWPCHVVKVILANLKPPESDAEYPASSQKYLESRMNGGRFVGKVWISLADTVWIHPMTKANERMDTIGSQLIATKLALSNKSHLKNLISLVRLLGEDYHGFSSIPQDEDLTPLIVSVNEKDDNQEKFHNPGDEVHWAHVEKSKSGLVTVDRIRTTFVYNPEEFYGIHEKFGKLLEELEAELKSWADNQTDIKVKNFEIGSIIACKPELCSMWLRGKILEVWQDGAGAIYSYSAFLVDYGETLTLKLPHSLLLPIPLKFVARLPFQAIGFSLQHVVPRRYGYWETDAKDFFMSLLVPDSNVHGTTLDISVFKDVPNAAPCRFYSTVAFIDEYEVGQTLVSRSLARYTMDPEITEFVEAVEKNMAQKREENATIVENDDESENNPFDANALNADDFDYVNYDSVSNRFLFTDLPSSPKTGKNLGESYAEEVDFVTPPESPSLLENFGDLSLKKNNESSSSHSSKFEFEDTPKIQPKSNSTNDKFLHPLVLWHQTQNEVILTIMLPDVQDYTFKVQDCKRTLHLRTDKPVNYGFELKLFGKVLPNPRIHVTGQLVKISLKKRLQGSNWPRLLENRDEKFKWLKENPDYWQESGDEAEESEVPGQSYASDLFESECTSSDDDDDDEDRLFAAPLQYWRDSDYDDCIKYDQSGI